MFIYNRMSNLDSDVFFGLLIVVTKQSSVCKSRNRVELRFAENCEFYNGRQDDECVN